MVTFTTKVSMMRNRAGIFIQVALMAVNIAALSVAYYNCASTHQDQSIRLYVAPVLLMAVPQLFMIYTHHFVSISAIIELLYSLALVFLSLLYIGVDDVFVKILFGLSALGAFSTMVNIWFIEYFPKGVLPWYVDEVLGTQIL